MIFHSPRACAHIARQMNLQQHYHHLARRQPGADEIKAQLFVSDLRDEHAVFGGGDQLRQCIDALVVKHRPQYIVIANSCVAGVIGEDTGAIAREAEAHWGIPVMAVSGHGFLDGDYYSGFYQAGKLLIERFMAEQPCRPGTVTLISDRGSPESRAMREVRHLLQSLNLQVHAVFPSHSSIAALALVPASALVIVIGGSNRSQHWLKQLAGLVNQQFGVPFADCAYPLGWSATKRWIAAVGDAAGQAALAQQTIKNQELRLKKQLVLVRNCLQGRTAILCIGRPVDFFSPEWALELIEMAGLSLTRVILLDSLTAEAKMTVRERLTDAGLICAMEEDEGSLIHCQADLVITTHELLYEQVRQVILPLIPNPGVAGLTELLEQAVRLASRYGQRGGMIFG